MAKYYGAIANSNGDIIIDKNGAKTGYFSIVGEMSDGAKVYKQTDEENDKQYLRTVKYGTQIFIQL